MQIRQHRGTLADSMKTVVEIENTKKAVFDIVNKTIPCSIDSIQVKFYTYDDRIKWYCHVVTVDGYGVYGFTDCKLADGNY